MDTGAFLAYLRISLRSEIPVILLTAATARTAEPLLEQGATEYILKPFDIDDLLLGVARYLRPRKSTRITLASTLGPSMRSGVDGDDRTPLSAFSPPASLGRPCSGA